MSELREYYGENSFIKQYYGEENLERIINSTLKKKKFSPEMKMVLLEIIKRRVEEFQLEVNELKQDLLSLKENLDEIKFRPCLERPKCLGFFNHLKRRIVINSLVYDDLLSKYNAKDVMEEIFATLTHEVYHAMGVETDKNSPNYKKDRIAHLDEFKLNIYQVALMETVIETASDRTSNNRSKEDFINYKNHTLGYSDLTFIVPILSNAFGLSEKVFLKKALRSRENLISFLNQKLRPPNSRFFLNQIEFALGNLHSMTYVKHVESEEQKNDAYREYIPQIYSSVAEIMKMRLEDMDFDMENPSKEIDKFVSQRHAILVLFANQLGEFMGPIKNQMYNAINICKPGIELKKRISNLLTVDFIIKSGKSKITHGSKEYYDIIQMIRKGKLDGNELNVAKTIVGDSKYQSVLVDLLKKGENPMINDVKPEIEEQRFKDDYNNVEVWDNNYVRSLILRIYRDSKLTFFDKVKRFFNIRTIPALNNPRPIENNMQPFGKMVERQSYNVDIPNQNQSKIHTSENNDINKTTDDEGR